MRSVCTFLSISDYLVFWFILSKPSISSCVYFVTTTRHSPAIASASDPLSSKHSHDHETKCHCLFSACDPSTSGFDCSMRSFSFSASQLTTGPLVLQYCLRFPWIFAELMLHAHTTKDRYCVFYFVILWEELSIILLVFFYWFVF